MRNRRRHRQAQRRSHTARGPKRLEYRGYDSAGVAVLNDGLRRVRSTGRVVELEKSAQAMGLTGEWALPTPAGPRMARLRSATPIRIYPGGVSVVHNGIIENHEPMRKNLREQGYEFLSDTDTEVIAHLIESNLRAGASLFQAVRKSVAEWWAPMP